ncbi:hypothetical protein ACPEEL_09380 [Pasteurella sp. PK-2025]|uniref:hypothetical protein n=1 Tax=Pasteurella sp. PK-2025 TaxID=3413133 RepID=UPI003C724501
MKPVINVAVVLLLSLGLVACGGGGGGGTSNNNAAAVNPNLPKDDVNYIDLEDKNKETITLENNKEKRNEKLYTSLSAYKKDKNILISGSVKEYTPTQYKEQLAQLNAKYQGITLIAFNDNNANIEQRSVLFTLKGNKISGHSVKTSADDVQAIFKDATIQENASNHLGFNGTAEIIRNQEKFANANYVGEFAGQNGEEIAGYFVDVEHKTPETQPKVSGGFIATREMKAESTATPKQ